VNQKNKKILLLGLGITAIYLLIKNQSNKKNKECEAKFQEFAKTAKFADMEAAKKEFMKGCLNN
jgi:hypothetical protein